MRFRARTIRGITLLLFALSLASASNAIEIYRDPQVAQRFKAGDSATRLKIIRQLFESKGLLKIDNSFLEAFMAGADDADQGVRHTSIVLIGECWLWKGSKQDPKAAEFLLKRTHSTEPKIRYACVYYGLSAMRPMNKAVIDRLIEMAVEKDRNESHAVFGRVKWGLRANFANAVPRIQAYLDRHDGKDPATASRAMNLFLELTGRMPERLEKFKDTEKYVFMLSPKPPFLPRTEAELKARIRTFAKNRTDISKLLVVLDDGKYYCFANIVGFPQYGQMLCDLKESELFEVTEYGPLIPEMIAIQSKLLLDQKPTVEIQYVRAFVELYDQLDRLYPCFEIKGIDWQAVGEELLPLAKDIKTQDEFALLCHQLLARLEDSHAQLMKGTAQPAVPAFPHWSAGFACLIDDLGNPVVYYVGKGSPAESAGVKVGMTILTLNDQSAAEALESCMQQYKKYFGFSSDRLLRYQAARWFVRQTNKNDIIKITVQDTTGKSHKFEMPATQDVSYLPRLLVPIEGISDTKDVSWKMLDDNIGYIYVRRIRSNLIADLDQAVADLADCQGLIIDVRGNSGGGFDASRSFRNFDLDSEEEPERARFAGPMAVLIDARCISAGEGWASWFVANKRARFFGETTAGASARKTTIGVADGLFRARFPIKAYRGFLDRPIERRGIEPDTHVMQNANDLAKQTDTVLEAARQYLLEQNEAVSVILPATAR